MYNLTTEDTNSAAELRNRLSVDALSWRNIYRKKNTAMLCQVEIMDEGAWCSKCRR